MQRVLRSLSAAYSFKMLYVVIHESVVCCREPPLNQVGIIVDTKEHIVNVHRKLFFFF